MAISTTTERAILDHVLRNAAFTPPTNIFVSLHSADPTPAMNAGEVTAGGNAYARQQASLAAASGSNPASVATNADLSWVNMPAVTVTYVGLFSLVTAGTGMWSGTMSPSKTTLAGDTLTVSSGNLTVSLT